MRLFVISFKKPRFFLFRSFAAVAVLMVAFSHDASDAAQNKKKKMEYGSFVQGGQATRSVSRETISGSGKSSTCAARANVACGIRCPTNFLPSLALLVPRGAKPEFTNK